MKSSSSETPLVSDLLLVGGGHSHVYLMKQFGMKKYKEIINKNGIRVTLITNVLKTPYSGMLPGYISGFYTFDEIHIDLNRLCQFSGIRLIHSAATQIDYENKVVYCADGRPGVRFDVLSLDVGITPSSMPSSIVTPVKPISTFASRFEELMNQIKVIGHGDMYTVLVVGGGAGGVELVLSLHYRLSSIQKNVKLILVSKGSKILPSHNKFVRAIFIKVLRQKGIEVRTGAEAIGIKEVESVTSTTLKRKRLMLSPESKEQPPILFDECLWCTSAGGASWIRDSTPFETTCDGSVKVNDYLECVNHPGVFAVGDCAHMVHNPRPKAGVFAVRAGPPLLQNVLAQLTGKRMNKYQPQKDFLSLISTGDRCAVASRGFYLASKANSWWHIKDYIDRKFMNMYVNLPDMVGDETKQLPDSVAWKGEDAMLAFSAAPMRCGGCGAKVGSTTVSRVLAAVHQRANFRSSGSDPQAAAASCPFDVQYDDAAIIPIPKPSPSNGSAYDPAMIHTLDFFRSFISDPFVFGQIATVHALSDCHAMGASAQSALALAVVPYSIAESITEETLIAMLSGASDALSIDGCSLVGGHTCEGAELALGLSVNGYSPYKSQLFRKGGCKEGDTLILTKPIGTGALFAADMRAKCNGAYVEEALSSMKYSNGPASRAAVSFNLKYKDSIHACTDITGFGLVGHLLEMLQAQGENMSATLFLKRIPVLEGAIRASEQGITSSLYRENSRSRRAVTNHVKVVADEPILYPLIFDPQTAGGLLFSVDAKFKDEFIKSISQHAVVAAEIGVIESSTDNAASLNIYY